MNEQKRGSFIKNDRAMQERATPFLDDRMMTHFQV